MMFTMLTNSGDTKTTIHGNMKHQDWTVCARLFTSRRDTAGQVQLFETLLEKALLYQPDFSFKDMVLLADLDKMIRIIVKKYGMRLWWDGWLNS